MADLTLISDQEAIGKPQDPRELLASGVGNTGARYSGTTALGVTGTGHRQPAAGVPARFDVWQDTY